MFGVVGEVLGGAGGGAKDTREHGELLERLLHVRDRSSSQEFQQMVSTALCRKRFDSQSLFNGFPDHVETNSSSSFAGPFLLSTSRKRGVGQFVVGGCPHQIQRVWLLRNMHKNGTLVHGTKD